MNVVWRPMAIADRERIFDYIAQDNPLAALQLDEEFAAKAQAAARQPTLYKPGRVPGTREIVVRPNYILVYQVQQGGAVLVVLRVLHAAQQWPQQP